MRVKESLVFILILAALVTGVAFAEQDNSDLKTKRIQIPEDIAMRNLITVVDPVPPGDATSVAGKVVLRIVIDKEGTIQEAHLLSGHPLLVSATVDAVKQWKFHPYTFNNAAAVEVETTATVEYKAGDPPTVVTPKPNSGPLRVRVSGGVMQSHMIRRVEPEYPQKAKAQHIQGEVLLMATIDRKGNITNLKAIQGDPILVDAAVSAVKQWKYQPYELNGEPAQVETTIKVIFHM